MLRDNAFSTPALNPGYAPGCGFVEEIMRLIPSSVVAIGWAANMVACLRDGRLQVTVLLLQNLERNIKNGDSSTKLNYILHILCLTVHLLWTCIPWIISYMHCLSAKLSYSLKIEWSVSPHQEEEVDGTLAFLSISPVKLAAPWACRWYSLLCCSFEIRLSNLPI